MRSPEASRRAFLSDLPSLIVLRKSNLKTYISLVSSLCIIACSIAYTLGTSQFGLFSTHYPHHVVIVASRSIKITMFSSSGGSKKAPQQVSAMSNRSGPGPSHMWKTRENLKEMQSQKQEMVQVGMITSLSAVQGLVFSI